MRPGIARLFVAVVVLGCGGATCLYSGAGPIDGGGPAMRGTWNPALAFIADLLTAPIPTAGIADVRDVALPVCAGVVLILAGASRSGSTARSRATRWMGGCAATVIVLATGSALAWRSFDLSWGWIVRFAAGAALAIVIAQRFTPAMVRQAMAGLLVVAVMSIILAIWHRADRGYAHFTWPIGPITIVGGLAAVWAALAGVWGVGLAIGNRKKAWTLAALVVCALSIYALQQTERRSPAMGLIAGLVVVASLSAWHHYPKRSIKIALGTGLTAVFVLGISYTVWQARSPDRETSGPIAVRKAYWEQSAKFIDAHPLLGIGPDRFVIDMTMAIAPLRAEMPHVYHGNLDTAAHNEWLQAAVELGVPGGLAYFVLPLGVLFMTLRSQFKSRPTQQIGTVDHLPEPADATLQKDRMVVAALAAALIALMVCEAASINLRGSILIAWYWTLLGFLGAASRWAIQDFSTSVARRSTNRSRPILLIAGGLACLAVSFSESLAAIEEVRDVFPEGGNAASRLYVEKTLSAKYAAAEYLVTESPERDWTAERLDMVVKLWKELFEWLPVYRDTAARYAESLIKSSNSDEAKRILESVVVSGMSPYDLSTNSVYATLLIDDSVGQFRCAQRALRNGAWRDIGADKFKKYTQSLEAKKVLDLELAGARQAAKNTDPALLRGATVELLRINAILQLTKKNYGEAIADQQRAAECYRRLEQNNNPYRRAFGAEWEAFYDWAFILFSANPENYRAAYDAIVEAERYAVLGIKHEKLLHPNSALGFIGGEVVPTEFPERLRPLWRLSAMLHMAVGDWRGLDFRILASLPQGQWSHEGLEKERASLAMILCQELGRIDPAMRPTHYAELCRMGGSVAPSGLNRPGTSQPGAGAPGY